MIVDLDQSLYEFVAAEGDKIVLKSLISGASELWSKTQEEEGIYLIRKDGQIYSFSETKTSPKQATLQTIKILSRLHEPILRTQIVNARQSLLSLLAKLGEPTKVGTVQRVITAELDDNFNRMADELGIWHALSNVPLVKGDQDICSVGSLGSLQQEYQGIKAEFLKLSTEADHPILRELGDNLFACILGESELEPKLQGLNPNIQTKLGEFQTKAEELKRKVFSFMKMDPLSDVETDY